MEIDVKKNQDRQLFWRALHENVEFHSGKKNSELYIKTRYTFENDIQSFMSVSGSDMSNLSPDALGCCRYLIYPMSKQQIYLRSLSTFRKDSPYYDLLQLSYYHEVSHALTNVLSRHQAGDVVWVGLREFGDTESHGEHLNEVANDYFTFLLGAQYTHILGTHSLDFILTHPSSEWGLPISHPPFFMADLCQPLLWTFCNLPTVSYDELFQNGQSPILSTISMPDGYYPVNEFLYASRMNADTLVQSINSFLDDNRAYETITDLIDDIRNSYIAKDSSIYSKVNQFQDICNQLFFFREIAMRDFFANEKLLEQYHNRYNQSWRNFFYSHPDYLEDHPKILKR